MAYSITERIENKYQTGTEIAVHGESVTSWTVV